MTTTEIAVSSIGALALDPTQTEWTEPQTAALAQLGIADAPAGDQLVFLHQAQRTGLDPFAKQLYMIKRWDSQSGGYKYTIQAGIDGLRVIAERTGRYEGRTPIQWCGEDGVWRNVWLDRSRAPVAARCAVYKRGFREPLEGSRTGRSSCRPGRAATRPRCGRPRARTCSARSPRPSRCGRRSPGPVRDLHPGGDRR
ncbi:recombinase RecT [Nocardiopsis composta]